MLNLTRNAKLAISQYVDTGEYPVIINSELDKYLIECGCVDKDRNLTDTGRLEAEPEWARRERIKEW